MSSSCFNACSKVSAATSAMFLSSFDMMGGIYCVARVRSPLFRGNEGRSFAVLAVVLGPRASSPALADPSPPQRTTRFSRAGEDARGPRASAFLFGVVIYGRNRERANDSGQKPLPVQRQRRNADLGLPVA